VAHHPPRAAAAQLGLAQSDVEVLAVLPPFLSKHMLSVTPVVARIPASFQPRPNPAEVEAVFQMPLMGFLEAEGHSFKDMSWEGLAYRTHFFSVKVGPAAPAPPPPMNQRPAPSVSCVRVSRLHGPSI
jgi:peroxisomal coenzyme A diphosphatase NUDT7